MLVEGVEIVLPPLPPPPVITAQQLADMNAVREAAIAASALALPAQPPPPVPVMTPELQAQLAALTQQAAAQLAALIEALRAAGEQLGQTVPPPPVVDAEIPDTIMPIIDPPLPIFVGLPIGETVVDSVYFPGVVTDPAPRDLSQPGGANTAKSDTTPQQEPIMATALEAELPPFQTEPTPAEAVPDLVPLLPAAPLVTAAPAVPLAAALAPEDTTYPAFFVPDDRSGAEGSAI